MWWSEDGQWQIVFSRDDPAISPTPHALLALSSVTVKVAVPSLGSGWAVTVGEMVLLAGMLRTTYRLPGSLGTQDQPHWSGCRRRPWEEVVSH